MPGGGPNLDMIGCAAELGTGFVLAHGESAACVMAAAYGRLSGTAGVALVTRGPGLTSAANGLAQATLDRAPLLLVSDTVTAAQAPRTAHQRLDQVAAARPLARWSGTLGTADPERTVAAALALATGGPAGGVHLAFDPTVPGDTVPEPVPVGPTDPAVLARAVRLLGTAQRPVVLVGLDAARHPAAVRAALARLDAPVLATYQGKGVVPESWPTCAGLFTGGTLERGLIDRADLVLGIGLDTVEPIPGTWPDGVPVVLVHGHATETAYFGAALAVVGHYDDVLPALVEAARPTWPPGAGAAVRRRDLTRLHAACPGLSPLDVVRVTHEERADALLTVDAGAHMLVAMPLWPAEQPDSVLISNGLATMGFALPAAIGAALARPDRRVVCLVGDGGLSMVLAELETLVRLALDVTVVVLDDRTLTLIGLKQTTGQGGPGAVGYGPTDFAAVARATGLAADTVVDTGGLRAALRAGPGPRLVAARIDPTPYTHVLRTLRG